MNQQILERKDAVDFAKQQFVALREEIENAKTRAFQVAGIGLLAVPSIYQISVNAVGSGSQKASQSFDVLLLLLPLISLAIVLIFLAENRAICRCGTYIKTQLEPFFIQNKENGENFNLVGWEDWIDSTKMRAARLSSLIGFYFLFCLYYLFSSLAALKYLTEIIQQSPSIIIFIGTGYTVFGVIVAGVVAYEHLFDFGERPRSTN